MKRKLFCIFLILASAAAIVGIILFSRGRSEFTDASPVYTIIFLSIVTIAGAAFYLSNQLDMHVSTGRGVNLLWIFRAVIVLGVLGGFSFFIIKLFPVSPFHSLVFFFIAISIVALVVAAWHDNNEQDKLAVSRRSKVILWAFRAVSIVVILACLAFIVIMWFLTGKYDSFVLLNVSTLMTLAIAGIAAAVLSLKLRAPVSGRGVSRAARCIPIAAALAITFALGSVYLNYLPKYSMHESMNILLSDKDYAQKDIKGSDGIWLRVLDVSEMSIEMYHDIEHVELFGGNPYYQGLFVSHCDSFGYDASGLHIEKGYILFNPATGEYEFVRTEEQDKTFSPADWPEFNYNFMYDKDGQHNAVLNLYFREWWASWVTLKANVSIKVDSGEWDAKINEVIYPFSFPEDEAILFLRSMGGETLKAKLLEQINILGPYHKEKTVEVFFFGINIATYKNGEIALKI